jgi:hypothetical protein
MDSHNNVIQDKGSVGRPNSTMYYSCVEDSRQQGDSEYQQTSQCAWFVASLAKIKLRRRVNGRLRLLWPDTGLSC